MKIIIAILFFGIAGCGDSSNASDGASRKDLSAPADLTTGGATDLAMAIDQSVPPDQSLLPDLTALPDLSGTTTSACAGPGDCRLYSSMCGACKCIPLGKNDPDPPCNMPMVTCFADPCLNKTPGCANNMCVVQ